MVTRIAAGVGARGTAHVRVPLSRHLKTTPRVFPAWLPVRYRLLCRTPAVSVPHGQRGQAARAGDRCTARGEHRPSAVGLRAPHWPPSCPGAFTKQVGGDPGGPGAAAVPDPRSLGFGSPNLYLGVTTGHTTEPLRPVTAVDCALRVSLLSFPIFPASPPPTGRGLAIALPEP